MSWSRHYPPLMKRQALSCGSLKTDTGLCPQPEFSALHSIFKFSLNVDDSSVRASFSWSFPFRLPLNFCMHFSVNQRTWTPKNEPAFHSSFHSTDIASMSGLQYRVWLITEIRVNESLRAHIHTVLQRREGEAINQSLPAFTMKPWHSGDSFRCSWYNEEKQICPWIKNRSHTCQCPFYPPPDKLSLCWRIAPLPFHTYIINSTTKVRTNWFLANKYVNTRNL
jgi:hypothetical protein